MIGIHPINEDLRFLRKLIRQLRDKYPDTFVYIKLSNNLTSHQRCLIELEKSAVENPICFLGHGRPDRLLGCKFRNLHDSPKRYVHDERHRFITKENIGLFAGKKVFCLACKSNAIGRLAVSQGTRVFIGFDEINFENVDLIEAKRSNRFVVSLTKWYMRQIVFDCLTRSIDRDWTFSRMASDLTMMFYRNADELILKNKHKKKAIIYKRAGLNLLEMSRGMLLHGDGAVRMSN